MSKLIALLGVLAGIAAAISALLYRVYLCTDIVKFPTGNIDKIRRWLKSKEHDELYITSRDGYYLHAAAVKGGSDWVVLMHGYDSEGKNLSEYAERFYNMGYSVLMPDQRGFGLSEGRYTTMGEKEQLDLLDWLGHLERTEKPGRVVLFGVSLGAATVMLASGRKLPACVCAVIEDCGYTSVYDEFRHNLRQLLHLPSFPFLHIVDIITRVKDGWSVRKGADCLSAVKRSSLPMLFIHGSADTFVPFYMQDELFEAASCEKEKLVIYGAGHAECMETDPEAYWSAVDGFLEKYAK